MGETKVVEEKLAFERVSYVPGVRGTGSLEHARATAKISMSDAEGGVRVLIRRNQTVVAALFIKGQTTANRDKVRAFMRAELMAGKLDKELSSWYQVKKANDAAREKATA